MPWAIKKELVLEVKRMLLENVDDQNVIAMKLGISPSAVSHISVKENGSKRRRLTCEEVNEVMRMLQDGQTQKTIAEVFKTSTKTISRIRENGFKSSN